MCSQPVPRSRQGGELGNVMAEVIVEVAPYLEVVSLISRTSAEQLDLKMGDQVTAILARLKNCHSNPTRQRQTM